MNQAETAIVRHNISILRHYPAVLIGGHGQEGLLAATRESLAGAGEREVAVETFEDRFFQSVLGYNDLLLSETFFKRFAGSDYVLICQQDAIVLSADLETWLDTGFAFVGAPMFEGYSEPVRPLRYLETLNGGLSLRHVPATLSVFANAIFLPRTRLVRVAEKLGLIRAGNMILSLLGHRRLLVRRAGLHEDVFWTRDVPRTMPEFTVPLPEIALRFAFETCPAELYDRNGGQLPFGCHAFEKYDPAFWAMHVPGELVPHVNTLAGKQAN